MFYHNLRNLHLTFIVFCALVCLAQAQDSNKINDLIEKSKNTDLDSITRLNYAKEATELAHKSKIDSLILASQENLSFVYLYYDNYPPFKRLNIQNLTLAEELSNRKSLATAHYNLGWYYQEEDVKIDSAFYHYFNAAKLYEGVNEDNNLASVLLNMANIQESEKDYIGSESNAIKAITILLNLPETENNLDVLWSLHNLLGIISFRLKQYDKSIEYHNKALSFSDRMEDNYINNLFSSNNLAHVYRELENYEEALNYHDKLLDDENLIDVYPEAYASYLNNRAYTKFLSNNYNEKDLKSEFLNAYRLCDTLNEPIRLMFICNNISEFYLSNRDKDSAFYFANKAYNLGKETQSFEDVLVSLKLMSEIKEGDEAKQYLNEHIQLSDSLLNVERAARNKFARIEFETDQIRAEKDKATRERLIFMISSIALLVTLFMLYIIITQRIKNKELAFSQQQQEANEEIYNLMLAQQDKIDEGRTQEKKRISEELHDGILGRLFGTRLSLDSLNLQNTDEAVKTRGQYIDELKSIEQEIRKISHDLNTDFVSGRSFSDIIETLIETQTQAYQLTYDYHEDDEIDWDALPNKSKIHVYRMLQETMQNTYKHAQAKHLKISFELKNNVILLTVTDDGKGFNLNKARKGIGLKNFESRAKEIQGKVNIISQPGSGTEVQIEIPIQ